MLTSQNSIKIYLYKNESRLCIIMYVCLSPSDDSLMFQFGNQLDIKNADLMPVYGTFKLYSSSQKTCKSFTILFTWPVKWHEKSADVTFGSILYKNNFIISVMPVEALLLWQQYPWPFGQIGCSLTTAVSEIVTHVTILQIVVFTVER